MLDSWHVRCAQETNSTKATGMGPRGSSQTAAATLRRVWQRGRTLTNRGGRDSSGQSLVEFSLLLPVMFMLFFGTIEMGRFWFTRLTVRHAVVEATRFAVTGQRLADPDTGDPLSRVESIERYLRNNAYTLDIEGIDIDPDDGGGPEDVVRVTVSFAYNYTLPGFKDKLPPVRFDISSSMRNEPFFNTGD